MLLNKHRSAINANLLLRLQRPDSLYTEELRALQVAVPACFMTESGTIAPIGFSSSLRQSGLVDTIPGGIAAMFPSLNSTLLEATADQRPQVTGKRYAVLFSGGPASGGHNVLVGLKKVLGQGNTLLGVKNGPKGLLAGDMVEIDDAFATRIMNTGGFDALGSDRTKITTVEQLAAVRKVVTDNRLDGIVIIGGDDSNTNAAVLAEKLSDLNCTVVGVPKTIDGDLQIPGILPISFGFATASRIYANMIGNLLTDAPSAGKYWHFVKLMGRSASHIVLEVALQTNADFAVISEEVSERNMTLDQIVTKMAKTVLRRAALGVKHGVILIPEGVVEFIPEMNRLIAGLSTFTRNYNKEHQDHKLDAMSSAERKATIATSSLEEPIKSLFATLPDVIIDALFLERDAHGNLQVSLIPTEILFQQMVINKIKMIQKNHGLGFVLGANRFNANEWKLIDAFKFATNTHFYGYEGRCDAPTRFDAAYTLTLGLTAGSLLLGGHNGYMAAVADLTTGGTPMGLPLVSLIHLEERHGKQVPVIAKALVELNSPAYQYLVSQRGAAATTAFRNPGPIQQHGTTARQLPIMVAINEGCEDYVKYNLGTEIPI